MENNNAKGKQHHVIAEFLLQPLEELCHDVKKSDSGEGLRNQGGVLTQLRPAMYAVIHKWGTSV